MNDINLNAKTQRRKEEKPFSSFITGEPKDPHPLRLCVFAFKFISHFRFKPTLLLSVLFLIFSFGLYSEESELLLRKNLEKAQTGDYVVTTQNKNYTILLIKGRTGEYLNIEEITIPHVRFSSKPMSWKEWVEKGAQGNTSWVIYPIHVPTGTIEKVFSLTKNEWVTMPQSQNFLSTLLSLKFQAIPKEERRKVGPPPLLNTEDRRSVWEPPLMVDGKIVPNVTFSGWRTQWPKDGSDLGGKTIEIYLPNEGNKYPSYFPYWLQVSGPLGKSKVRIIDSGSNLSSPGWIPKNNSP